MERRLQEVRGTKDLLVDAYLLHDYIVNSSLRIGESYGFKTISTPILEYTEVFDRSLGETSEIISKEMYNFVDKGGRSVSLRPEFTAAVMRSVITHHLYDHLPLRYSSAGPLFRYDNPQAGRQRQFHQVNFEHISRLNDPLVDAEIIKLASDIIDFLKLKNDIVLEINSLGCEESRKKYQEALLEYFTHYSADLSHDSQRRLHKNPLRVLDSKDPADKKIAADAPKISTYYTKESEVHFEQVLNYISMMGINYTINDSLVRGLDYYCHTIFEFTTERLGAQSSVLSGGRYDGLFQILSEGNVAIPACGFALGVERIALMLENSFINKSKRLSVVLPIQEEGIETAVSLVKELRKANIPVLLERNGKLQKRLQFASKNNAKYAIFIGAEELEMKKYKIRDLDSGNEQLLTLEEVIKSFQNSFSY